MNKYNLVLLMGFSFSLTVPISWGGQGGELSSSGACTPSEHWKWPERDDSIGTEWIREFEKTGLGGGSKVRSFSEALSLRKLARNSREKAFSEYWMSRTLFTSGMVHLAEKGFHALIRSEVDPLIAPFQLAALSCLGVVHKRYSGLGVDGTIIHQISKLSNLHLEKPIIWEAALQVFLTTGQKDRSALELLKGSGPFEAFALGILHSSEDRFEEASKDFTTFFASAKGNDFFNPFLDRAHLLAGRAAYSLGHMALAIAHYQAITTRSNERVHGLSELSWSFLLAEKYREAIGITIGLQSGSLKQTFAPEALMVMAMALNEMCRFPESMSVIQSFRRNYRDSFFWLKQQVNKDIKSQTDLYRSAIEFAKRLPTSKVPAPVASEWIRSALFLSNQERINLIFSEKNLANELSLQGKNEQRMLTMRLLKEVREIQNDLKVAKIKMKPGDGLPNQLMARIQNLKLDLIHLRHIRGAGPIWRKILGNHQARVPQIQTAMVAGINAEINRINQRMYSQLNEIAENNELIEVEILNGAGEDIIWQNAHPGFAEAAQNMKHAGNQTAKEKVWDWGTTQGGLDGRSEIWEDEVGSLAADLYDSCESKDKYLAVERNSSG